MFAELLADIEDMAVEPVELVELAAAAPELLMPELVEAAV
jgi:hypothetical protein